jgi:hypothetical protein
LRHSRYAVAVPLTPLKPSEHVAFAQWGSVVISWYSSWATNVSDVEAMYQHQQAVIAQHGKISNLMIIRIEKWNSAVRLSEELRKKSVEVTNALNGFSRGNATVILGKGLPVTIVRMFMTGFNLMTRSSFPIKVFGDTNEAIAWLQTLPGQVADANELTEASIFGHFLNLHE